MDFNRTEIKANLEIKEHPEQEDTIAINVKNREIHTTVI